MWPELRSIREKEKLADLSLEELYEYFEPNEYSKSVQSIEIKRHKGSHYLITVHFLEVTDDGIVNVVEYHHSQEKIKVK